jgi:hypothetical protein
MGNHYPEHPLHRPEKDPGVTPSTPPPQRFQASPACKAAPFPLPAAPPLPPMERRGDKRQEL